MLIKRALGDRCGSVSHVSSVSDGLSAVERGEFDLIVTDLNLPDSAEVRHVEALRSRVPATPIVVLTSSTSLHDAVAAMRIGARDFIVKTFDRDFKDILSISLERLHAAVQNDEARRKLEREMGVLRSAIENGDEGLAIVSTTGLILYANSAFRGFARRCGGDDVSLLSIFSELINKSPALRDGVREKLERLSGGAVWTTELTLREGSDQAFDLTVSMVESGGSVEAPIREAVVWVRDRSELKRRERFQRELLSTTTHDLKGPLGAILLSSELLRDTLKDGGKTAELALRIGSSAQGAIHLIDEFLSARRIQEGSLILKPTPQPMGELLEAGLADYTTIAAARRIDLSVKDLTPAGTRVEVDRMGFLRVLGNLVTNALKFTPSGGRVGVEARLEDGDLAVQVTDTGSGMEPAEVQRVFERFSRLERHRDVEGSGLGLFVVKSIVSAHGGEISVTSKAGEGTTFVVNWPGKPPVNERGELISLDLV
jgi:signal transduction histidine kinase/ActR/RegA family two-component response regulator